MFKKSPIHPAVNKFRCDDETAQVGIQVSVN